MKVSPILLCGGVGQRLWPISNQRLPKQFSSFFSDKSLFQETLLRVKTSFFQPPIIVTGKNFVDLVKKQLTELDITEFQIIEEPNNKNTAASILSATYIAVSRERHCCLVALPCDHYIPETKIFQNKISEAVKECKKGSILTLGITPNCPSTEYGYLELDAQIKENTSYGVARFIEKPDLKTATKLISNDRYFWNAGIFTFTGGLMLDEAQKHDPELSNAVKFAVDQSVKNGSVIALEQQAWAKIEPVSIDKAIMEKSEKIRCKPFNSPWSDLGTWNGVHGALSKDQNNNLNRGKVQAIETTNSTIWSQNTGLNLIGFGLSNMTVVASEDTVLVMPTTKSASLKDLLAEVNSHNEHIETDFERSQRPWGWFETLVKAEGYRVKRLQVFPGGKLSLQSHKYRSEHWTVTSGIGTVQIGDNVFNLGVNHSTYIDVGSKHRLSNNTNEGLTIIETQIGTYLEEDDIIRYEDIYKR